MPLLTTHFVFAPVGHNVHAGTAVAAREAIDEQRR